MTTTTTIAELGLTILFRDRDRGVCMWHNYNGDGKWCATPVVRTHSPEARTPKNPDGHMSGERYALVNVDELGPNESMWICARHRDEFLALNGDDFTIYEIGDYGTAIDVTPEPSDRVFEVSVRLRTPNDVDNHELSNQLKSELTNLLRYTDRIDGWQHLKVVDYGLTTKPLEGWWAS